MSRYQIEHGSDEPAGFEGEALDYCPNCFNNGTLRWNGKRYRCQRCDAYSATPGPSELASLKKAGKRRRQTWVTKTWGT